MIESLRDIFPSLTPEFIKALIRTFSVILIAFLTYKLIGSALNRLLLMIPTTDVFGIARVEQRKETLRHIFRSFSKALLVSVIVLQIAKETGYGVSALAGAGIAGLAVGFGAQSLVKDIISGFFILFEDQYGVGDVVRIGEFSGVVERMTLRATMLRNLEGQVHVIPNGSIQNVTVMTREWARAVLDITIQYEEELSKVYEALERVGSRLAQEWPDRILEGPTVLGIERMDDIGVTIRSIVKTPPFKQADLLREWRLRVKEEFDRSGIQFSKRFFPDSYRRQAL
jgi:small-conductance mechanosensitive channel